MAGRWSRARFEEIGDVLLGFAEPLGDDVRSFDRVKAGAGLGGEDAGDEGLAGARRTVEEGSAGRVDAEGASAIRILDQALELAELTAGLVGENDVVPSPRSDGGAIAAGAGPDRIFEISLGDQRGSAVISGGGEGVEGAAVDDAGYASGGEGLAESRQFVEVQVAGYWPSA